MNEKKKPEISIIIPAYNAESFISTILSDVQNQTFSDYEVIIINDGSYDRTVEIAQSFVDIDTRFVLFSQDNSGISQARNKGLDLAEGHYIAFYDADDRVPENALKDMYECIVQNRSDMVVGLYEMVRIDETVIPLKLKQLVDDGNASYLSWKFLYNFSVCNKLFKRSIIEDNGLSFMDIGATEDGVFLFQYLCHCNTITTCNSIVYRYIKHGFNESLSLSSLKTHSLIKDRIKTFAIIKETVERKYHEQLKIVEDEQKKKELQTSFSIWKTQFYIRTTFILLQKYYRYIWDLTDESCSLIMEETKHNKNELSVQDWDNPIFKKNNDIMGADRLLISRTEMLNTPIVSILITANIPKKHVEEIIARIYGQMMPSFEVIADARIRNHFITRWDEKDNFRFISHIGNCEKFVKSALKETKGEFIYIVDEPIFLSNNTLLKAWRVLKKKRNLRKGFISIPLYNRTGHSFKPLLTSQFAFADPDDCGKDVADCDCAWGNKLFRNKQIKKFFKEHETFWKGRFYIIEQLYEKIPFVKATDQSILAEITDDYIIKKNRGNKRKRRIKDIITL